MPFIHIRDRRKILFHRRWSRASFLFLLCLLICMPGSAAWGMGFKVRDRGLCLHHLELWQACLGVTKVMEVADESGNASQGPDVLEDLLKDISYYIDDQFDGRNIILGHIKDAGYPITDQHRYWFHQGFDSIFPEFREHLTELLKMKGVHEAEKIADQYFAFSEHIALGSTSQRLPSVMAAQKRIFSSPSLKILFPSESLSQEKKRREFLRLLYCIHILGDYATYSMDEIDMLAPPSFLKTEIKKAVERLFGPTRLAGEMDKIACGSYRTTRIGKRNDAMNLSNVLLRELPPLLRERLFGPNRQIRVVGFRRVQITKKPLDYHGNERPYSTWAFRDAE